MRFQQIGQQPDDPLGRTGEQRLHRIRKSLVVMPRLFQDLRPGALADEPLPHLIEAPHQFVAPRLGLGCGLLSRGQLGLDLVVLIRADGAFPFELLLPLLQRLHTRRHASALFPQPRDLSAQRLQSRGMAREGVALKGCLRRHAKEIGLEPLHRLQRVTHRLLDSRVFRLLALTLGGDVLLLALQCRALRAQLGEMLVAKPPSLFEVGQLRGDLLALGGQLVNPRRLHMQLAGLLLDLAGALDHARAKRLHRRLRLAHCGIARLQRGEQRLFLLIQSLSLVRQRLHTRAQRLPRLLPRAELIRRQADLPCLELLPLGFIPAGLGGLAFQGGQLASHLGGDIRQPRQMLVHFIQAADRLLALGQIFGDTAGLLEDPSALLRLGGEDHVDMPLLDDRVRPAPQAGAEKELLDILQATGGVVDQVFAFPGAIDAAGDRQLGEGDRQHPPVVVDRQADFRHRERGFGVGPVEDHVLQARRPHVAGIMFSQDPADRIDEIGFSRPVWPDDGGHAGLEVDGGGRREGLKPEELELPDTHTGECWLSRGHVAAVSRRCLPRRRPR